jgi:hypothetical protein
MNQNVTRVLYGLLMVVLIVGLDLAFFRDQPMQRLAANIGIVLVFGALYFRFFKS